MPIQVKEYLTVDIIFLNIIADGILYFDVPFNMGLYDKFQLENPKNFGYTTIIFLVDNATNRIAAMLLKKTM